MYLSMAGKQKNELPHTNIFHSHDQFTNTISSNGHWIFVKVKTVKVDEIN
jgi:hypothetical protein